MSRWVLHVDLDEFIAAVEVLRHPQLADKPVIVGGDGDPTKRGVVSTANYEARRFGVGSAMPLRTAYKRCPEAVFLPVDAPAYEEASKRVMAVLRTFPAVVEVAGWDEAFMAISAEEPETFARKVQAAVLGRTFQQDLEDPQDIRRELLRLTRELMKDLERDGRPVHRLVVKVRFVPFITKQRSKKLEEPTLDAATIETGALAALDRFELDR